MIGIIVETYFGATLEETYESTLVELKWALHLFHITGQLSVKQIIGLMEFHQFKKEARCLKIKKSASYLRWSDKDEGFQKLSKLFKNLVRISCPSAVIW